MSSPDAWNVTPAEGAAIQRRLRRLVRRRWSGVRVRLVAGADVHFPERDRARAAIAVLSYPGLEPVERAVWEGPCSFPYIPGLLSFREIPPLLEAWRHLKNAPDLVLCDGQGVAHPRGLGLASHLGLVLGVPTIGCAKSPLYGSFDEPPLARGGKPWLTTRKVRTPCLMDYSTKCSSCATCRALMKGTGLSCPAG